MYDKRRLTITAGGATTTGTLNLASEYVEVIGYRATAVTDTTTRVNLTDARGVMFLDAGDIDYTTVKDRVIGLDDTMTGLTAFGTVGGAVDSTGAARTIGNGQGLLALNPITVTWLQGTAADILTFDLYYRYPVLRKSLTLTVPNPAATITGSISLDRKYTQVVGFSALLTGTDTAVRLKITDADSRVVYLDAADKDYKTAEVHRQIGLDDTLTGLTPQHLDATGTAATATSAAPVPVVKSPLTLEISNGATAGDTIRLRMFYLP